MIISRGMLEILESAMYDGPKSFNDFTKIAIKEKRLSPATVSKRLDELTANGNIEEVIIRSKTGRRVIAYKTTEKGKKAVEHAKNLLKVLNV